MRPAPTTRPRGLAARTPSRSGSSEHPADVNPRYGIAVTDTELGPPNFVDTGTSFPLSANAVNAEKASSDEGPDPTYTATLPSSQRCG